MLPPLPLSRKQARDARLCRQEGTIFHSAAIVFGCQAVMGSNKPLRHYPPRHRLLNDPASEHPHSPRRRLFVDPASEQRMHRCPPRPRLVDAPVSDAQHCRQPRRRLAVTPVSEHRREPQRQVKVTPAGKHCHPPRRRLFVKPASKESKQSKRRVSNAVHAAPTCCRASDQRVSTLVSSVADLTSCQ